MRIDNIGGYRDINTFVKAKLERFSSVEPSFASLYSLMFSESDNVMYEKSVGYRIEKTTYGECRAQIESKTDTVKEYFSDAGHDGIIGIYMENGIEWIQAFWCILHAGFRPLLMNMRLDAETLEKTISELDVKGVISDGKIFSVRTLTSDKLTANESKTENAGFGSGIFVMSSGTSANVKVCAYGAAQIAAQIKDSYGMILECPQVKKHYEGQLKLLTFLPFYHIFGLIAVYIWFAFFSRTFVQLNNMQPETIVNTIRRHKVTHIFAVPLFWNKVYDTALSTISERGEKTLAKFRKGMKISEKLEKFPALASAFRKKAFREVRDNMFGESIRFMITGGSEIKPEVIGFFNNIGYCLSNGYGMSEIGITSVELSGRASVRNSRSVGKPLSSVEYSINGDGELLVRGSTLAGYIIEGGVKKISDGWFNTHDLAECRDGRYYILGRRDDIVISPTGENLNPNLIEPKLSDIDGVREICLIPLGEGGKITPTLIVCVDRFSGSAALNSVKEKLTERLKTLNLGGQITQIIFTSTQFIRGDEIKLNRRLIKKDYLDGNLTLISPENADSVTVGDMISDTVRGIFAKALGISPDSITEKFDFFTDGGGTSLDYFAVASEIQAEFEIKLPFSDDECLSTVADISAYIGEKSGR